MAKHRHKTILFLCTGNYYRSRFAEILFNAVAKRLGLSWNASSRGLALERGTGNVGSMAASAIKALGAMGIHAQDDIARFPQSVTADEIDRADLVVALKESEHRPLLVERFGSRVEQVEFWDVDDDQAALGLIEREIMGLVSRLISGGQRKDPRLQEEELPKLVAQVPNESKTKGTVVRVGRETKGRRGKGVTTVSDLPLDEAGVQLLASKLKQTCGTGGTAKDGRIEIQGDQRERISSALEGMGYRVKRVGG